MNFFALQFQKGDSKPSVAQAFLQRATDLNRQCKTLEVLDVIDLGGHKYLRFRTDLNELAPVVLSFFPERSVIVHTDVGGGYTCKLKNRDGLVGYTRMQTTSTTTPVIFRGNAIPHWERQFLPKAK